MEKRITSMKGCLPLPDVPISEEVYFSDFKKLFPVEQTPMFLGQILFERSSFIESIQNFELQNTIKGLKHRCGVTEDHCNTYQLFRKQFQRQLATDIFQLDPSFFTAAAKRINVEHISVNYRTQIGEQAYRGLLNGDGNMATVFKKFHLYTFLCWMKKQLS